MLFWSESVDLASPVGQLACCDLLIDLERNVMHHTARLTGNGVAMLDEILGAESLDGE